MYIHGLYLEGCRWDPLKRVLVESQPKVQLRKCPLGLLHDMLNGTDAISQCQTSPAAPLKSVPLCMQVLFTPAPCMWLRPKRVDKMSQYPHYSCPVYRTAERRGVLATTGHSTNFVMFVRLPTIEPASHWTLNGVALITSLSD